MPKAYADTFQVKSNQDSGDGSLREAIDKAARTPGLDIIDLTGLRDSIVLKSPLVLNSGNDIKFVGDGNTTLSGQIGVQIMTIRQATVVISRLNFTNGLAIGGDGATGGGGGLGAGGALLIDAGNVTLNNVTFLNNFAIGGNGSRTGANGGGFRSNGQKGGDGGGLNSSRGSAGGNEGIRQRGNVSGDPGARGGGDGTVFGAGGGGGGGGAGQGGHGGSGGNGGFGGGGGGGGGGGNHNCVNKFGIGAEPGLEGAFGGKGERGERKSNSRGTGGRGGCKSAGQDGGTGGKGGGGAGLGGAIFIYNNGRLTLFNCVFNGNSVMAGKGGGFLGTTGSGPNDGKAQGANIFNYGSEVRSTDTNIADVFHYEAPLNSSGIIGINLSSQYYEYNGSFYSLSSPGTWQQAQAQAQSLGANLVTINDSTENSWLTRTFNKNDLWIGLTDEVTEGQFKWVSGETSTSPNSWHSGEPNNGGGNQDYAVTNFRQLGQWDDQGVGDIHPGIIENKFYDFNGSRYLLSGAGTWEQAQSQAASLGGYLATVDSEEKQNWLIKTFGGSEKLWIGLRRKENQFKWVSGETSSFADWYSGEPNNSGGNESYVEINFNLPGKWNDASPIASRRGVIEISLFGAVGANSDSQFFTLAKPTKFNITARGGSGTDIFQLQSYDGLKTSQQVFGGKGSDIFNISVESSSGIIGLDFNAGKLRELAKLLVEPDLEVREQRLAADISAAVIGLGIDYAEATASTLDITGLSDGAVSAIAATFHFANDIANIEANYALDVKEYQNSLAEIGNFFDNQGNRDWGTVDITQKRSLVEVMDFEPGIDTITLPKNTAYRYDLISDEHGSAIDISFVNQTNQATTFLRLHIDPTLLPTVQGQSVGLSQFIQSLFVSNSENSVIGTSRNNSSKVAVSSDSYSGTIAGDYIYVKQNNPTVGSVKVYGLDGDDLLAGRKNGSNEIYGGDGDDLIAPGTINDIIDGGKGYDQVNYSDWDQAVVLKLPLAPPGTIRNVESVVGTRYNDTIDFSTLQSPPPDDSAFNLQGLGGNDTLVGSPYRDVISGDEGNDSLDGGAGAIVTG